MGSIIDFRISKCKQHLDDVDSKVDFILKNYDTINIPLPPGIKYLVPVVCSSFPEYIWDNTEDLFLNNKIPRVATYQEILEFDKLDFEVLKNKPFVKRID
jgi:hypothetical protein